MTTRPKSFVLLRNGQNYLVIFVVDYYRSMVLDNKIINYDNPNSIIRVNKVVKQNSFLEAHAQECAAG